LAKEVSVGCCKNALRGGSTHREIIGPTTGAASVVPTTVIADGCSMVGVAVVSKRRPPMPAAVTEEVGSGRAVCSCLGAHLKRKMEVKE